MILTFLNSVFQDRFYGTHIFKEKIFAELRFAKMNEFKCETKLHFSFTIFYRN